MDEWRRGTFRISTDKALVDLDVVHEFLTQSYWSPGIDRATVARGIEHALVFGMYHDRRQIGFARVITDFTRFGYLADVFVVDAYRGQGLGVWLVETILAYEPLRDLRRWLLATRDAHTLYAKFGFGPLHEPKRWMERRTP